METTSLAAPDVRAFLSEGTRTGKLAYTASDGRPLVVPVWFALDGEEIVFETGAGRAKARSLTRDPRTTLCVDLEAPPYAFVQVQGVASITDDPAEVLRVATVVARRYMGEERAEEFGARNAGAGQVAVRLRPTKVQAEFDVTG